MPDTLDFLIFGLFISLGTMILYALSLWWRMRGALRDMDTLYQLRDD